MVVVDVGDYYVVCVDVFVDVCGDDVDWVSVGD